MLLPQQPQALDVSYHTVTAMTLEEIYSKYALNDGETKSLKIDISKRSCSIRLLIRKAIEKQKFQKCEIELFFSGVINIDISEDFKTSGTFSDITFTKTFNGNYYLSLDPYGNTGEPHENDNFIIISSSLNITEENGETAEVS